MLGEAFVGIPTVIVVAIITAIGGIVLKMIDARVEKRNPHVLKRDYLVEIKELTDRIDSLEEEIDVWRNKYYANEEEITQIRKDLINAGVTISPRSRV